MKYVFISLAIVLIVFALFFQPIFYVSKDDYAIVEKDEKAVKVIQEAGLYFKLPDPTQKVKYISKSIGNYDAEPTEVISKDNKSITLEYTIQWRIEDILTFYKTINNVKTAIERMDDIVYFQLRESLINYPFTDLTDEHYPQIMRNVATQSSIKLTEFSIEIIDIQIKKSELTPKDQQQQNLRHLPYIK
ncbi:MAG: hypothetical protein GQ561_02940 [Calditrichae bacterium]|nr:hypothetical protein [Calditrichia bacterium]